MDINRIYRTILKRFLDIAVAMLALIFLAPVFLALYVVSIFAIGRPVFFKQIRPGLNAVPFELVKFRTMRNLTRTSGELLPDSERLTKYGKFLRSTSVDELPELLNILKGDMSLVGPRPLLMEYLPRYSPEQSRRHSVRPGLTGLAQIGGRNALSWKQKFELDCKYVDQMTFWMDLKIIWLTIGRTLKREGITPATNDSMPVFMGNNSKDEEALNDVMASR